MEATAFTLESFFAALAIIGIVIIVSALLSGLVDKNGLPEVAIFLGIGAALGPAGLGVLDLTLDSPILKVVATLSLTLVLFTDAVALNINEVKRHARLAFRMLGPGTILAAALTALVAWTLLGLPAPAATILGAALASTDPVLLRGLLRRRDIPSSARQALQLESGLNDAVLLPVIIIAMAFMGGQGEPISASGLAKLGLGLFILGPGAGIAVGLLGVAALDLVRKRIGIRRDYESLYSLGVAFTAFAAAEAVHGSGFLAAFTAGLTIAALDVELCDCFIEYGGVTAEMMLLFTFVLFGSSLIWSGLTVISGTTLLFAAFALLIRTPVYLFSLLGSKLEKRSCLLIAWFGPSGLSSLLLILLPVFAGLPGSEQLFPICCLVVLLSVLIHGGSPMLLAKIARRRASQETSVAEVSREFGPPEKSAAGDLESGTQPALVTISTSSPRSRSSNDQTDINDGTAAERAEAERIDSQRITIDELRRLQQSGDPVIILDVRTDRSLETSDFQAKGAVRMPPDHVVERAQELRLPKDAWLIAYCA